MFTAIPMADWLKLASKFTGGLNLVWGTAKETVSEVLGIEDPIQIMPYRGYGTPQRFYLRGRVLEDQGIKLREENASLWKNAVNMYRRFESDEIPRARVKVSYRHLEEEVITDDEGYFEIEIRLAHPVEGGADSSTPAELLTEHGAPLGNEAEARGSSPANGADERGAPSDMAVSQDPLWQRINFRLLHPCRNPANPVEATGEVIVVTERTQFAVVSDIDDTIMETAATDLLKMFRIAYLGNERTRRPFSGIADFYHALQNGKSGHDGNPIFYVSSSATNMYDLFEKFLDINKIPPGPILLRDVELSLESFLSFKHETHKMEKIRPILEWFPQLPFILIGDSGQKDVEIYHRIVQDYPGRIAGLYIRDVTPNSPQRHQEIMAIAQQIRTAGTEFVMFSDTSTAIQHARKQGWIAAI